MQWTVACLYVLTFCLCTTIGTCAAIPDLLMHLLTSLVLLLEIIIITRTRIVKISLSQGLWLGFFGIAFISIIISTSPFSLITLNLLAAMLFLVVPFRDFYCFILAERILIIFALFSALGVYVQIMIPSLWAPIYQFLTVQGQYLNAENLRYSITVGGYSYLSGFFYNAGFTATYLVNGIIATMISRTQRRWKIIIITVLSVALILTGKRGQVFALLVALAVAYIFTSASISKSLKRVIIIVGTIMLFYAVGYYIYNNSSHLSNSVNRVLAYIYGGNTSDSGRESMADQAISLFSLNPLIGVGWRQLESLIGSEPHNSYVQILTETGALGLLSFIISLTVSLLNSIGHFKRLIGNFGFNKRIRNFYYCIICFEVYFIVLSFVENTFCNIEFYYMLFFILALDNLLYRDEFAYIQIEN